MHSSTTDREVTGARTGIGVRAASRAATAAGITLLFGAVACGGPDSHQGDDPATNGGAGAFPAEHVDALHRHADSLFGPFADRPGPGVAVMVVHDGHVELAQGYGLAELDPARPLDRTTPIRLGSLGKQFTAMAVMLLQERGQLTVDDPAANWLPELSRFEGVTIRHLLTHTSGIPDYYGRLQERAAEVADVDGDPLLTEVDAMSLYGTWGEPVFPPGSRYEYSNPGYEALAVIVERVSGERLDTFLESNVFGPLGMTRSGMRSRPEIELPGRAIGYAPADGGEWVERDDHPLNWIVGAGGVYSTLDDLVLWNRALDEHTLVTPDAMREAVEPFMLTGGAVSHYGFGWVVEDRLGRRAMSHTGGWVGFRTAVIRLVDDDFTVVVLSNAADGTPDEMAEKIAGRHLGVPAT